MHPMKLSSYLSAAVLAVGALCAAQVVAQESNKISNTRPTELRADKLPSAAVLARLPAGASLRLLALEGGWAWVEHAQQRGWVRAGALQIPMAVASAATLANGREAAGNHALALSVRALPARASRHALIISVAKYADARTQPLPGTRIDRESATQIARAMQVPNANIRYLQDEQATGDNIRKALAELNERVQEGDRVFVHYSGHGTRFPEPQTGECIEALSPYDGSVWQGVVTHREMSQLLQPITRKADKLFVMYDACHSGGMVTNAPVSVSRGHVNRNDEGVLRGRVTQTNETCAKPSNFRSRSLVDEATQMGSLLPDIVHLSAARHNEVSLEDAQKGGLATQYVRDCMLRDAKDLDVSGAISMEEIQQCAQAKINERMKNDPVFTAQHLTLSGNKGFVPAWFSLASPAQQVVGAPSTGVMNAIAQTPVVQAPPVSSPANLTGAQALRQIFDQRDAKRRVKVMVSQSKLRMGQDKLDFSIQSDRGGYVYVAMAGSDNRTLGLLFPNGLDSDNRIEAGQQLLLPRPSWPVTSAGPAGVSQLLVMVADGPRDIGSLPKTPGSPFVGSLNDAQGRANLGALITSSKMAGQPQCQSAAGRINPACSDAFGAEMFTIEETP